MLRYLWRTSELEPKERPPYKLTPRQEAVLLLTKEKALSYARGDARGDRAQQFDDLQDTVLEFWYAMFAHELKASEFDSGIISALAIQGINPHTLAWADAMSYTPKLSAVVTTLRWLVIYRA